MNCVHPKGGVALSTKLRNVVDRAIHDTWSANPVKPQCLCVDVTVTLQDSKHHLQQHNLHAEDVVSRDLLVMACNDLGAWARRFISNYAHLLELWFSHALCLDGHPARQPMSRNN